MRQKIVAGNWKMNTLLPDGLELAKAVDNSASEKTSDALMIIAPPFTHLYEAKKVLTEVRLAAQNCSSEESGAYTGEVSVDMIKSTGAEFVIIGHSERREYFNEDDELLAKKAKLVLSRGLNPIFCIGEVLEEREDEKHFDVVASQLKNGLFDLNKDQFLKVVIAYEPVWAIGTGKTATPDQAQEMHAFIRKQIKENYDDKTADETTILYGGSCKPGNAKELFSNPDVDGGLIGGASLKSDDFIQIVNAF